MASSASGKSKTSFDEVDSKSGEFKRSPSSFRDAVSREEGARFPPAEGRYVLYICYACPWANRCLATVYLKGLEHAIEVVVVEPVWGDLNRREGGEVGTKLEELQTENPRGWVFALEEADCFPGSTLDFVNGCKTMRQLYELAVPDYSGKYTVPVFWDKQERTIVNNESAEIIRMLNEEFNDIAKNPDVDITPPALRADIDRWNDAVYNTVNNGVYRCGFASTQEAYSKAFRELFDTLDMLEQRLGEATFLCGDAFTEADLRLFVTLIRFDSVYVVHFKTNLRRIIDYPNILRYMKAIYRMPPIRRTIKMDQIKNHYFGSHPTINPHGIVPDGPDLSYLDDEE